MITSKHKLFVPYVEQMQQTECGLCCVAMIMRYYKSNEKITKIREYLEAGRDGLKLSNIAKYLNMRGMDTKIYKTHYSNLSRLPLPAIIFWNDEHFVVLEKYKDNKIWIVDPAFGRRKIDEETFVQSYSEVVMTVVPTEEFVPIKESNDTWIEVIKHMKTKKKSIIRIVVLSLLAYWLQMGVPIMIQKMIDAGKSEKYLPVSLWIMLILGLVNYIRGYCMVELQVDMDGYLSKGIFSKLLRLPYKYFEGRSAGDILFRLNSISNIRDLLSEQIIQTLLQAGVLLFILVYMMMKSALITGIAVGVFVVTGIFIFAMKSWITEVNQDDMMKNTTLQTVQVEAIYSMFAIKVSAMEADVEENWLKAYERCLKSYKKKNNVLNFYSTVLTLVQTLMPVLLLGIGIHGSMTGNITLGESMAIYSLAGSFFSTGISIYNSWNDFVVASSYMERLHDITDMEDEKNPEEPIEIHVRGGVDIQNVSFAYTRHSERVLSDVNIRIGEGEKVAIVGTSGAGKTTLAKLILGLYEPTEGDICYDGVSIRHLNKTALRKQIGVVPQDMTLFNQSIYENIRMKQEELSMEDVEKAAEVVQIRSEIEQMPMKYYTMVSDMGMNLSGGQRQRIALARAIIHDKNLIVLDEATSALDYEKERKISDYMGQKQCTRIIIAHRLSTIIDADKIIVLDGGKVCEVGKHDELMKRKGTYARLYYARKKSA